MSNYVFIDYNYKRTYYLKFFRHNLRLLSKAITTISVQKSNMKLKTQMKGNGFTRTAQGSQQSPGPMWTHKAALPAPRPKLEERVGQRCVPTASLLTGTLETSHLL